MRSIMILSLSLGIIALAGCSSDRQETGTLTGHVDIGPLQPVARVGEPEPTPSPEVYAAWQIIVLTKDGKKEIARANIDSSGNYQVLLFIGTYMVTAKPVHGGGLGAQQIHLVEIQKGSATQLDVEIDTGIR
jgi:hypothetical protein